MEEQQVPPSLPAYQTSVEPKITPEQLAEMKAAARELAIQQTLAQQSAFSVSAPQPPKVIYVKRNLTVAELLLVLLLSCGIVTGIQWSWNFIFNVLPRVEIRMR